jgi:uncharacterized protein (DUF927 family)
MYEGSKRTKFQVTEGEWNREKRESDKEKKNKYRVERYDSKKTVHKLSNLNFLKPINF